MREETKQQVREIYAGAARFSGAIIAVIAVWSIVLAVMQFLNQEPFGGSLLIAIFAGTMAAVLLSARAEDPESLKRRRHD